LRGGCKRPGRHGSDALATSAVGKGSLGRTALGVGYVSKRGPLFLERLVCQVRVLTSWYCWSWRELGLLSDLVADGGYLSAWQATFLHEDLLTSPVRLLAAGRVQKWLEVAKLDVSGFEGES